MKMTKVGTQPAQPMSFTAPAIGRHAGSVVGQNGGHGQVVPMDESVGRTLAELTPMSGQNISVNVTSANPNLSFKEWMLRGVVGGAGNLVAFPFRLIGKGLEALMMGVIGIVKTAIIIILIPTLIWAGYILQQHISHANSVHEAASSISVQGANAFHGVVDGAGAKGDPITERDAADAKRKHDRQ